MITTREITPTGFGKKVRSWDEEKTFMNGVRIGQKFKISI
jgi:hypothetical protein